MGFLCIKLCLLITSLGIYSNFCNCPYKPNTATTEVMIMAPRPASEHPTIKASTPALKQPATTEVTTEAPRPASEHPTTKASIPALKQPATTEATTKAPRPASEHPTTKASIPALKQPATTEVTTEAPRRVSEHPTTKASTPASEQPTTMVPEQECYKWVNSNHRSVKASKSVIFSENKNEKKAVARFNHSNLSHEVSIQGENIYETSNSIDVLQVKNGYKWIPWRRNIDLKDAIPLGFQRRGNKELAYVCRFKVGVYDRIGKIYLMTDACSDNYGKSNTTFEVLNCAE